MKKAWFPALFLILFVYTTFLNATPKQQTDSNISEVTVYENGALVTRTATAQLTPGRNEILFSGLTNTLNPQTIQLKGDGEFIILSTTHQFNYLTEHPQKERLQQLTEIRDSLNHAIQLGEATGRILDRELNILMSNTVFKGADQNLTAAGLKQVMEYFHEKLTQVETDKLEINRKLEQLREELKKVNQQISELNNGRSQTTSRVAAVLQSDTRQQVRLTLSYLVNRAGWYPSYDVRVSGIQNPVELSYKANIYQTTGVDWDDVQLTVSSARPEQGGILPGLDPWYIDFYTPLPPPVTTVPQMEERNKMRARQAAQKSADQQAVFEEMYTALPVQEIQNQTSFSYKIELPYNIPSAGKPLTVEMKRHEVPAGYRYYTSPKLRSAAYLTANISEWGEYNLLPGEANLFFENTYVGKSNINPRVVADTLTFSLGRDESVVIERAKLREFEEKNFFGSRVRESFVWEISIRNSKNQPVVIEVEDQVPVSQHEDIRVEVNERSGADYDRSNGRLLWKLEIGPNQSRKIRFEYEVEYPRGKILRL